MKCLVAIVLALAACAPRGEIILYVDTDAPVPAGIDDPPDPTRPSALFDRLRIDVLRNGVLALDAGATRDFAIDSAHFSARTISVGIAPVIGEDDLSARVRMFRGDRLISGEPPISSTLDTTVRLPAIGTNDRRELSIVLHTTDVGVALGNPNPVDAIEGAPTMSLVGSWAGGQVVPCASDPRDGEACVPGGAFWFGPPASIQFDGISMGNEQLVVVSPFFIDLAEVTVGAFRPGFPRPGEVDMPTLNSTMPQCDFTATPSSFDALPINCLSRDNAARYCTASGKQLPSEAQYEFIASGRGLESNYPWGDDVPRCDDAVFGQGAPMFDGTCGDLPAGVGAKTAGTGSLDRVPLGDRTVVDLAGNLAEIMRDAWAELPDTPPPGVATDPVTPATDNDDVTFRGGSYLLGSLQLQATSRDHSVAEAISTSLGFRCVRKGN